MPKSGLSLAIIVVLGLLIKQVNTWAEATGLMAFATVVVIVLWISLFGYVAYWWYLLRRKE
jgi:hypothetical protein